MLAWLFPVILLFIALLVVGLRSKSSNNLELPKWKTLEYSEDVGESTEYTNEDATIEEDEARG